MRHVVVRTSFSGLSIVTWKKSIWHTGIRGIGLDSCLTGFRIKCLSAKRSRTSRSSKVNLKPNMADESDAFYVVRKGDIVGIYKRLSDCQAQVSSSVCDPSVSVYKGYCLRKETEDYLASQGFKDALYSMHSAHLKDDMFGTLVACPFQVCELNGTIVDKLLGTIVHNKEAYDLYNYYAHHIGFSVRKDHVSYWPNTKNIKSKDFLCSKAGFKKTLNLNSKVKFQKSDIRIGCAAMIRFVVDIDDNWTVKKFIEIHNYFLADPVDHHLLRSNWGINEEKAAMLKLMKKTEIRATDAFNYLVKEVSGIENARF